MKTLTIQQTISNRGDSRAVLAHDNRGRSFVGVAVGDANDGAIRFVEIDRVTWLELERGEVGLDTVVTERANGAPFETRDYVAAAMAANGSLHSSM